MDVLANDSDPDGHTISIAAVGSPANGAAIVLPRVSTSTWQSWLNYGQNYYSTFEDWYGFQYGTSAVASLAYDIEYTPDAGFSGVDSFTYTIDDGNGLHDTATVQVSVAVPNSPPVAVDDSVSTDSDTVVVVDVLVNDSDPDGDAVSIATVGAPSNGSAVVLPRVAASTWQNWLNNGQGSYGTFEEWYGFQYGTSAVASLQYDIEYTPHAGFVGADTFTYTIEDPDGASDSGVVSVNVLAPVNAPPVADDDNATATTGQSVVVDVLVNDSDPEGDPIAIIAIASAANGAATLRPRVSSAIWQDWLNYGQNYHSNFESWYGAYFGTSLVAQLQYDIEYTPTAGYIGTDAFTYTIEDGQGNSDTASVTVNVVANQPPVAVDDSATTETNQALVVNLLANDFDPENQGISIDSVGVASNGLISLRPRVSDEVWDNWLQQGQSNYGGFESWYGAYYGSAQVANLDYDIEYVPDSNFTGTDSFTYTITDALGAAASATVTVTVAANQPPAAVDDVVTTLRGTPAVVDVLGNDSDPDGHELTITQVSDPDHGSVELRPRVDDAIWDSWINLGQFYFSDFESWYETQYGGTGSQPLQFDLLYTPNAGFSGADQFTYTIDDGRGGVDTAVVSVTVLEPESTLNATGDFVATAGVSTGPIELATFTYEVNWDWERGKTFELVAYHSTIDDYSNGYAAGYSSGLSDAEAGEYAGPTSDGTPWGDGYANGYGAGHNAYYFDNGASNYGYDDTPYTTYDYSISATFVAQDGEQIGYYGYTENGAFHERFDLSSSSDDSDWTWAGSSDPSSGPVDSIFDHPTEYYDGPDGLRRVLTGAPIFQWHFDQSLGIDGSWQWSPGNQAAPTIVLLTVADLLRAEDHIATVDWGDGHVTLATVEAVGTVTPGGTGVARVVGEHTFAAQGEFTGTVTVEFPDGDAHADSFSVDVVAQTLSAGGISIAAAKGEQFSGELFTFTDTESTGDSADYLATIHWGDGTSSQGVVTHDATSGHYSVAGTHIYLRQGTVSISIRIEKQGAAELVVEDSFSVWSVSRQFDTVDVSSGEIVLATFEHRFALSGYAATVDWGDGTVEAATLRSVTGNGSSEFLQAQVVGAHTYASPGDYTVTITIAGNGTRAVYEAGGTVNHGTTLATSFPLTVVTQTLSGVISDIVVAKEVLFDGEVATFTDSSSTTNPADYVAVIDWGDGVTSTGAVSFDSTTGVYSVAGTHTYPAVGGVVVSVRISKVAGAELVLQSPVTIWGAFPITGTVGVPLDDVLATFEYSTAWDWDLGTEYHLVGLWTAEDDYRAGYASGFALGESDAANGQNNPPASNGTAWSDGYSQGYYDGQNSYWYDYGASDYGYNDSSIYSYYMSTYATFQSDGGDTLQYDAWSDGDTVYEYFIGTGSSGSWTWQGTDDVGSWNDPDGYYESDDGQTRILTGRRVWTFPDEFGGAGSNGTIVLLTADQLPELDDYSATIDWGDGTVTDGTLLAVNPYALGGLQEVRVVGDHTYAAVGSYQVDVTITGPGIYEAGGTISHGSSLATSVPVSIHHPAADDEYTVSHDRTLTATNTGPVYGVLENDLISGTLVVRLADPPQHGTLDLADDGTFMYTPDDGYVGDDTFSYIVNNGTSDSRTALVTIHVINAAPSAGDDLYDVHHGQVLTTTVAGAIPGVTSNDQDADGDSLTVSLVTSPQYGQLSLNPDGSFTYTPISSFTGSDSFQYRVSDGLAESQVATVTIDVTNQTPVAVGESITLHHSTSATINLLANDTDPDGDTLSVQISQHPAHGTVVVLADGEVEYTPTTGYVGSDSFSYVLFDGAGYSPDVQVTINVTNTPPQATGEDHSIIHTRPFEFDVRDNDLDSDSDPLTALVQTGVQHGTLMTLADGSFRYTPDAGFVGTDSFTYLVSDGAEDSNVVTATFNITNSAPVSADSNVTVAHTRGSEIDIGVATADADGDPLTVTLVTGPANGTAVVNPDGTITYTPNTGFTGTDSFTYTLSDGVTTTAPATVTIDVTNTAPVATADTYSLLHDTTLTADGLAGNPDGILANDSDAEADPLTVDLMTDVSHGTLSLSGDGTFTYTPNAAFVGDDSFEYRLFDGLVYSETVTVTLSVTNLVPVATADTYSVLHDRTFTGNILSNDSDPDGEPPTIEVTTPLSTGSISLGADGAFTFTPDPGYTGTAGLSYRLTDGAAYSDIVTVTIDVTNQPPVAGDDSFTVSHSRPATLDLAANESDPDPDETLTRTILTDPIHGTLTENGDGTVTYTPNIGFVGSDSFTYELTDGAATSGIATVTLDVTNSAPVAEDDSYTVRHDRTLEVTSVDGVAANDHDADGDALSYSVLTSPANGVLTLNPDGTFTYQPDSGWVGTDSFTYEVTDGAETASAAVTIDVTNALPVATGELAHVFANRQAVVSLLANDSDADGDPLTVLLHSSPANGTIQLAATGSLTYVPNTGFNGTDSVSYTVWDGMYLSDGVTRAESGMVSVTFQVLSGAPVVNDEEHAIEQGTELRFDPRVNDLDPEGDRFRPVPDGATPSWTEEYSVATSGGTAVFHVDGTVTYRPDWGFYGTDTITYQLWDGVNVSDQVGTTTVHVRRDVYVYSHGGFDLRGDLSYRLPLDRVYRMRGNGPLPTLTLLTPAEHADITITADAVLYEPTSSDFESDSFVLVVDDGTDTYQHEVTVFHEPIETAVNPILVLRTRYDAVDEVLYDGPMLEFSWLGPIADLANVTVRVGNEAATITDLGSGRYGVMAPTTFHHVGTMTRTVAFSTAWGEINHISRVRVEPQDFTVDYTIYASPYSISGSATTRPVVSVPGDDRQLELMLASFEYASTDPYGEHFTAEIDWDTNNFYPESMAPTFFGGSNTDYRVLHTEIRNVAGSNRHEVWISTTYQWPLYHAGPYTGRLRISGPSLPNAVIAQVDFAVEFEQTPQTLTHDVHARYRPRWTISGELWSSVDYGSDGEVYDGPLALVVGGPIDMLSGSGHFWVYQPHDLPTFVQTFDPTFDGNMIGGVLDYTPGGFSTIAGHYSGWSVGLVGPDGPVDGRHAPGWANVDGLVTIYHESNDPSLNSLREHFPSEQLAGPIDPNFMRLDDSSPTALFLDPTFYIYSHPLTITTDAPTNVTVGDTIDFTVSIDGSLDGISRAQVSWFGADWEDVALGSGGFTVSHIFDKPGEGGVSIRLVDEDEFVVTSIGHYGIISHPIKVWPELGNVRLGPGNQPFVDDDPDSAGTGDVTVVSTSIAGTSGSISVPLVQVTGDPHVLVRLDLGAHRFETTLYGSLPNGPTGGGGSFVDGVLHVDLSEQVAPIGRYEGELRIIDLRTGEVDRHIISVDIAAPGGPVTGVPDALVLPQVGVFEADGATRRVLAPFEAADDVLLGTLTYDWPLRLDGDISVTVLSGSSHYSYDLSEVRLVPGDTDGVAEIRGRIEAPLPGIHGLRLRVSAFDEQVETYGTFEVETLPAPTVRIVGGPDQDLWSITLPDSVVGAIHPWMLPGTSGTEHWFTASGPVYYEANTFAEWFGGAIALPDRGPVGEIIGVGESYYPIYHSSSSVLLELDPYTRGHLDWGDGTVLDAYVTQTKGQTIDPHPNGLVGHVHKYFTPGTYTSTLDVDGVSFSKTVTVVDRAGAWTERPPLGIEPGIDSGVVELGRFAVVGRQLSASEISVTIDWRDGVQTAATLEERSDGSVSVLGSHLYTRSGLYHATIRIESAVADRAWQFESRIAVYPDLSRLQFRLLVTSEQYSNSRQVIAELPVPSTFSTSDVEVWMEALSDDWGYHWGGLNTWRWNEERRSIEFLRHFPNDYHEGESIERQFLVTQPHPAVDLQLQVLSFHVPVEYVSQQHTWQMSVEVSQSVGAAESISIGDESITLLDGQLRLSHVLDPVSGLTLVYDSATTSPRPTIVATFTREAVDQWPTEIEVELDWGDRERIVRTFSIPEEVRTSEATTLRIGIQLDEPVEESGEYNWKLRARLRYGFDSEGSPQHYYFSRNGYATIVANDQFDESTWTEDDRNDSETFDPTPTFGAGWSVSGLMRVVNGAVINGPQGPEDPSGIPVVHPMRSIDPSELVYRGVDLTRYVFDEQFGFLRRIEPLEGPPTTFEYDERNGRITAIIRPGGERTEFHYEPGSPFIESITLSGGRQIDFEIVDGLLVEIRHLDATHGDLVRTFDYNDQHDLTSDVRGSLATEYEYDSSGSVVRVTQGANSSEATTTELLSVIGRVLSDVNDGVVDDADQRAVVVAPFEFDDSTGPRLQRVIGLAADGAPVIEDVDVSQLGRTTYYSLDDDGLVLELDRPGGNGERRVSTWERSYRGRPTGYVNEEGDEFRLKTDNWGNITEVSGPHVISQSTFWYGYGMGQSSARQFAGADANGEPTFLESFVTREQPGGRPVSATGPGGFFEHWTYRSDGNLATYTDANGAVTEYVEYDSLRRLVHSITRDPAGADGSERHTWYEYDAYGNVNKITDSAGNVTDLVYDAVGRLRSKVITWLRPDGTTEVLLDEVYDYYASGLLKLVSVLKEAGNPRVVTEYEYNSRGDLIRETQAKGTAIEHVTLTSYYADGSIREVISGTAAQVAATAAGTSAAATEADVVQYFYDPVQRKQWVASNNVAGTTNSAADPTTVVDSRVWEVIETELDAAGRTIREENKLTGLITEYEYPDDQTAIRREYGVGNANGTETTLHYDYAGRLLQEKSSRIGGTAELTVVYGYDDLGYVNHVERIGADGDIVITDYVNDAAGNVLKESVRGGTNAQAKAAPAVTTVYQYNGFGELRFVINAEGGVTEHRYDAAGNLQQTIDRNGVSTSFVYDALGRLRLRTDPDGATYTVNYDLAGNVISEHLLSGPNATSLEYVDRLTTYSYDELGRLIQTTGGSSTVQQLVERRGYDNGRWDVVILTPATAASLDPTATGLPMDVTWQDYDSTGKLIAVQRPGETAPSRQYAHLYSPAGFTAYQTAEIVSTGIAASPYRVTTTSYSSLGWLLSVTDTLGRSLQVASSWDAQGRVLTESGLGGVLTTRDYWHSLGTVRESSNAAAATLQSAATFQYDARGNLVHQTTNTYGNDPQTNTVARAYDGLNRVVSDTVQVNTFDPNTGVAGGVVDAIRGWQYVGLQTFYTDRNGQVTTTTIDPVLRTVTTAYAGVGIPTEFAYNAAGDLIYAVDDDSSIVSTYDAFGRSLQTDNSFTFQGVTTASRSVSSYTAPHEFVTSWGLEDGGVYDGILSNTFTTDALGRVNSIRQFVSDLHDDEWKDSRGGQSKSVQIDYNLDNSRQQLTRFAGTDLVANQNLHGVTEFSYFADGRTQNIVHWTNLSPSRYALADYTMVYDTAGRLDQRTITQQYQGTTRVNFRNFDYDDLGQLTTVTETIDGVAQTPIDYAADPSGARAGTILGAGSTLLQDAYATYTYDAEGRQTSRRLRIPLVATNQIDFQNSTIVEEAGTWDGSNGLASYSTDDDAHLKATLTLGNNSSEGSYDLWIKAPDPAGLGVHHYRITEAGSVLLIAGGDIDFSTAVTVTTPSGVFVKVLTFEGAPGQQVDIHLERPNGVTGGYLQFSTLLVTPSTIRTEYDWDAKGHLVAVRSFDYADSKFQTVTYAYDALGRKTGRHVQRIDCGCATTTETTGYVYDGTNILWELDLEDGSRIQRSNLYGPSANELLAFDMPILGHDEPIWTFADTSGTVGSFGYYHVATETWSLLHRSIGEFGEQAYAFGEGSLLGTDSGLAFGGHELDRATGLYDQGGRWYDPNSGRFLDASASQSGSANPYRSAPPMSQLNGIDRTNKKTWLQELVTAENFWTEVGHFGLDVVGMIPVYGEWADAANAAWYSREGRWEEAALSSAAAVPIVGWGATAAKWGRKSVQATRMFHSLSIATNLGISGYHVHQGYQSGDKLRMALGGIGFAINAPVAFRSLSGSLRQRTLGSAIVTRNGSYPNAVAWFDEAQVVDDMGRSMIGRIVRDAAESNHFRLEFSRSFQRSGLLGRENRRIMGMAFTKKAKVYLPTHHSIHEAAATAIHEGVHMLGVYGSKRAEVLARAAAHIHTHGSVTRSQLARFYREVLATPEYQNLPTRIGQHSPLFPGITF